MMSLSSLSVLKMDFENNNLYFIEDDCIDWSSITPSIEYDEKLAELDPDIIIDAVVRQNEESADKSTYLLKHFKEESCAGVKQEAEDYVSYNDVKEELEDLPLSCENNDPLHICDETCRHEERNHCVEDSKEIFISYLPSISSPSKKLTFIKCEEDEASNTSSKMQNDNLGAPSTSTNNLSIKEREEEETLKGYMTRSKSVRYFLRPRKTAQEVLTEAFENASLKEESNSLAFYHKKYMNRSNGRKYRKTHRKGGKRENLKKDKKLDRKLNNVLINKKKSHKVCSKREKKTKSKKAQKLHNNKRRLIIVPANEIKILRNQNSPKKFSCFVCGYASNQQTMLALHIRRHLAHKPFKCNLCDYASVEKSHLIRHTKTHTGERPHSCPFCIYSSIQKSPLNKHILKWH